MDDISKFMDDMRKSLEAAIARREQRENNPLLLRIEELEVDLHKAETSLSFMRRERDILHAENRRLFKENNEVKKELRALKQVVSLQEAVEGLLKRIEGFNYF
jgi:predicted nuclease with TOPRIM domain